MTLALPHSKMKQKDILREAFKFAVVGLINTALAYLVYVLCIFMGMHYILANFTAFTISMINAYTLSEHFVFKKAHGQSRPIASTFLKTAVAYSLTGVFLNSFLLYLFIEQFGFSVYISQFICIFISTPINFILNKYWAYKIRLS